MAEDTSGPRMVLSAGIIEQLKTIKNADNEEWFSDATLFDFPNFNSAGYPTGIVVPSNVSPEFETSLDNTRFYDFITIFYTEASNLQNAYRTMRQLEDDILDLFDNDYTLGGAISNLDSSKYTMIDLFAAPSSWERVTVQTGNAAKDLLLFEIRLRVNISYEHT